ncbi:MAG: DUF805 domain-containing protein [Saprospiraceae bacterium]
MMFRKPFSFDGRIRRLEFGLSIILYYAVLLGVGVIMELIGMESAASVAPGLILIFYIPALWFLSAQGAKRCHDRNNSGWYQLIPLYMLWMLFAEGDRGDNSYGADPKGRDNDYTDSNILDSPETF